MSFSVTSAGDWVALAAAVLWVPFALVLVAKMRRVVPAPPRLFNSGIALIMLGPLAGLLSQFLHMRDNPGLLACFGMQFVGGLMCIPWGLEVDRKRREANNEVEATNDKNN